MRPAFKNLKIRSLLDLRSTCRCEGHIDKAKKRQDHQTRVLLINARTGSTNRLWIYEIRVDYSTSTEVSKLQEKVKRTKPLRIHNNGKSY